MVGQDMFNGYQADMGSFDDFRSVHSANNACVTNLNQEIAQDNSDVSHSQQFGNHSPEGLIHPQPERRNTTGQLPIVSSRIFSEEEVRAFQKNPATFVLNMKNPSQD